MNFEVIKKVAGSPKFDSKIVVSNQSAKDIMKELLIADKMYSDQYKKIAPYFDDPDNVKVAQNIFDFIKDNIKYVIETEKRQTTKSPAYLFHTKKGDCKNYSNFAAGIFKALNIPYFYRFAGYDYLNSTPTHVYIVYLDNNGNEQIFDAVLKNLGDEAPYKHKIDKKPMALYRMSGVNNVIGYSDDYNTIGKGKIKKALKKAGAGIKKAAKKVKGKVVTYSAAPVRGAFLSIIAINAFKSRDRLAAAIKKNPDRVKKFWNNFGGNFTVLKKAAKVSGAPVIGVAVATLVATATPAVIAFKALLKEIGVSDLENAENVGTDVASVTDVSGDVTDADTNTTITKGQARGDGAPVAAGKSNTLLYVALAGAGLYFLTKKK